MALGLPPDEVIAWQRRYIATLEQQVVVRDQFITRLENLNALQDMLIRFVQQCKAVSSAPSGGERVEHHLNVRCVMGECEWSLG